MLTFPDWKQKQILFIQTDRKAKNRLFFRNENIVFEKDEKIINQASCHRVLAVFIIGDFSLTSGIIKECRKRAVSLFLLGNNFNVYGSVVANANGNYMLRMAQYSMGSSKEFNIAKYLIFNKFINQESLLKSGQKLMEAEKNSRFRSIVEKAQNETSLLGLEGNFSKVFFQKYFKEVGWLRRMPRVKPDIINFLLDMGYTFLFNILDALLSLFGFDTYKGCYHKLFFQRKSLTCDIMEPFRCIIEKQILKSYHLKQVDPKDFTIVGRRYVVTYEKSQKYAKIFMEALMEEKEALYLFTHQFYRYVMGGETDFPVFNINNGKIE